jgi:LysR family nitrogen assimilation transcriptional regulator
MVGFFMMELRRLAYFIKVVDLGSMTRAASQLGVAQSALSNHIAALEVEFRTAILVRGATGVTPTEAGRTLYRHAHAILRRLEDAHRDLRGERAGISGVVTIGMSITTAELLAFPLLRAAHAELPEVQL